LFNNGLDIQNIFSRVTGNSISQINGILTANGTANLFFLNPNGIVFGPHGTIALGGSFFGTTAKNILFADGFEFQTNTSSPTAILTMSRPIGMGLSNPGQIVVQGTGHQLRLATDNFEIGANPVTPILGGGQSSSGLRTAPNQILGLIGGQIIIDGGI
jgi:filamentous hemagglutinin family protein